MDKVQKEEAVAAQAAVYSSVSSGATHMTHSLIRVLDGEVTILFKEVDKVYSTRP